MKDSSSHQSHQKDCLHRVVSSSSIFTPEFWPDVDPHLIISSATSPSRTGQYTACTQSGFSIVKRQIGGGEEIQSMLLQQRGTSADGRKFTVCEKGSRDGEEGMDRCFFLRHSSPTLLHLTCQAKYFSFTESSCRVGRFDEKRNRKE